MISTLAQNLGQPSLTVVTSFDMARHVSTNRLRSGNEKRRPGSDVNDHPRNGRYCELAVESRDSRDPNNYYSDVRPVRPTNLSSRAAPPADTQPHLEASSTKLLFV